MGKAERTPAQQKGEAEQTPAQQKDDAERTPAQQVLGVRIHQPGGTKGEWEISVTQTNENLMQPFVLASLPLCSWY